MEIELFVFSVNSFQFSIFHENEVKRDKLNCKRGMTVTFEVKNL